MPCVCHNVIVNKPHEVGWNQRILDAYHRIRSSVVETPVEDVPDLVPKHSLRLLFKMENLQQTGSFKLRGATNKILSLTPQQARNGVIAASNGNHGLGVAAAAKHVGIRAMFSDWLATTTFYASCMGMK